MQRDPRWHVEAPAIVDEVKAVFETIRKSSPLLREAGQSGNFKMVGAVYDIKTAKVSSLT